MYYMIETKKSNEINTEEVQSKKRAAELYCELANEYTSKNNGKTWKYKILPHDMVKFDKSFVYLVN